MRGEGRFQFHFDLQAKLSRQSEGQSSAYKMSFTSPIVLQDLPYNLKSSWERILSHH